MKAQFIRGFKQEPRPGENEPARDIVVCGVKVRLLWADDDGGFQHFFVEIGNFPLVHLTFWPGACGYATWKPVEFKFIGVEYFSRKTHTADFIRFDETKDCGKALLTRDGFDFIYE